MSDDLELSTVRAVSWRLLPIVFLLYFVSLIDRANLAFGALAMNRDLGLDAYAYSLGAAAFFIGYIPFEIPSNIILTRVGARVWIGRIAVSWGLAASAMALVSGPTSFVILRFMLGVAEAGLVPGIVFYLTQWFPSDYRARVNGAFLLAVPASGMIGAPLGSSLLELNGLLGLRGWQWMFMLEGIPSLLLGLCVFRFMTDRPAEATWLSQPQREWLQGRLGAELAAVETQHGQVSTWRALRDPRVAALCGVYFAFGTATYGLIYYLPLFVKEWGLSNLATGWVVAVPEAAGVAGMLVWSRWSDRIRDRRLNLAVALLLAATGVTCMGLFGASQWSLIAVALAAVGVDGGRPMFWALPPTFLSRTAMAGVLALISCCANFGGLTGTLAVGWIKAATGSFTGGLYYIAVVMLGASAVVLLGLRSVTRQPESDRTRSRFAAPRTPCREPPPDRLPPSR